MNMLSLVAMVLFTSISLLLIRSVAPYQKTSKLKYVSLKSKVLAELLIPKKTGYVKVAERKKISLFSLIFYSLFAVLVLALIILVIMPDIPCEPFLARLGSSVRGVKWHVHTLNEKWIILIPMLFFVMELITYIVMGTIVVIKNKTESKKTLFGVFATLIMFIGLFVFFVFQLF